MLFFIFFFFFRRWFCLFPQTKKKKYKGGVFFYFFARFDVQNVVLSGIFEGNSYSRAFHGRIQKESSVLANARRGMIVDLGEGVVFQILFPDRDVALLETNDASVVGKLIFEEISFLFTGDSPQKI